MSPSTVVSLATTVDSFSFSSAMAGSAMTAKGLGGWAVLAAWKQVGVGVAAAGKASEENVNLSASAYWVPGQDSNKYLNYGAGISEVEIDLLTGAITLLRGDLVYDCGKSLNTAVDLGQIEGSFIQGIGFFIYEEYITNSDGLMISNSTWDYKIPSVDIIPKQFNAEILNTGYHKNRVLSSKASGEPALVLASSVHCALREAIRAARKEFSKSGSGRSPLEFQMDVPAPMTLVKELCGFDIVENYLETLSTYELADGA
nr:unnamed protein product [Digitaria exilis]